jgi:hypothetical protein
MKENRNKDEISITELSNVFELTMDKIYHVFGDKTFKRYQGNEVEKTLNRSIMDCLACTFVNYDNNNLISKKVEIIKLMDDMLNTENESYVNQNNGMSFRDSVTKWTSSKSVLKTRVDLWRRNFNSLMSG